MPYLPNVSRYGRLILAGLLALATGCHRPAAPAASAPNGRASAGGWEVRYNAVLSLARRGSPHVKDPEVWDTLLEMLDEDQQLRNFRAPPRDGRAASDEAGARLTVLGALRAVQELHHQQPKMDLSGLKEPIEKLTHSPSALVASEAKQTLLALNQ
jgi:hypothetical protein